MNPVEDSGAFSNTDTALSAGAPMTLTGLTVADRSHYVNQTPSLCSSVKISDPNSVLGPTFFWRVCIVELRIPHLFG
jgi:hypothetical protein